MIESLEKHIEIEESKVENLNRILPEDKILISECFSGPHKVTLWLESVIRKGKKCISLNGMAFRLDGKEYIEQKRGVLGVFQPNTNGTAQIKSACSSYTVQGMYDVITY